MEFLTKKNLADYVTMKIGGPAKEIVAAKTEQDVVEAAIYAKNKGLNVITLGCGSNSIFKDAGFDGLVIINQIPGLEIDNATGVTKASAGVIWDEVVQKAIDANLCGTEALSRIPGTVGAAPVNNIGAYGQEIKDTLVSVRAFDTTTEQFVEIPNDQCDFSYRHSRFKEKDHGRFIITKVTLQLKPTPVNYQVPNYPALLAEIKDRGLDNPTPKDVRQVIIALREERLPNPAKFANSGSFFKNPIVDPQKARELLDSYPNMPHYVQKNGDEKLAASWLIDQASLKNYRQNGIWIYDKQALVLVNESANSFKDLWLMAEHVISAVHSKFDVLLEPEPEII